ncbi:MAG: hypothetical protein GXO36_04555 [Chloroflexi bacterium]|nr:hypothetical protein [Chloroflexota bacterium]
MRALVAFILYATGLAWLTWPLSVPPEVLDYYAYTGSFMRIFHLGMLGYALTLAVLRPAPAPPQDAVHCPFTLATSRTNRSPNR